MKVRHWIYVNQKVLDKRIPTKWEWIFFLTWNKLPTGWLKLVSRDINLHSLEDTLSKFDRPIYFNNLNHKQRSRSTAHLRNHRREYIVICHFQLELYWCVLRKIGMVLHKNILISVWNLQNTLFRLILENPCFISLQTSNLWRCEKSWKPVYIFFQKHSAVRDRHHK